MSRFLPALLAVTAAFGLVVCHAKDAAVPDAVVKKISKALPGVAKDDIRATPVDGIYEIRKGTDFGYVTGDGRYLIHGDLTDLQSGEQLTELRRMKLRLDRIAKVGNDKTIEFAPAPPVASKYTVSVFTDIDCGYCRKLHKEMADYNAKGIAVRYYFYPRSGPGSESFKKAEAVWCSKDRQDALTRAKGGEKVAAAACANPVMEHYQVGEDLGLRGTPMLVLPDGEVVSGYLPAAALAARLASPPQMDATAKN